MKTKLSILALAVVSLSAHATSDNGNNGVQKQLDELRAGLHDVHMNTLQKYSESWGLEDRANIAKLQDTKLDKSVFLADQARQDKALVDVTKTQAGRDAGQDQHINAVQDAAQSANEKGDANAVRADRIESSLAVTDDRSISNAVRLDGVETVNSHQQAVLTQHGSDIVQLYNNGEYAQSRIDAANANIQANRNAIDSTNRVVSQHTAQLANHEQRLGSLEQETNRGFADMGKRIDKVQNRANAGVATALSSAAIPQVTEYQSFALGAGVGGYEGEQALAVGFSSRVSSNVVLKASVARDTQQGTGWNVGTSIGW